MTRRFLHQLPSQSRDVVRRGLNSHIAIIVAGTDARTSLGIDAAIRRGEAYAKAGADIIFIESPESESERSDRPWMCR
jgi:2-methylisocitrate lyase-like PEP mutase family enzyme